MYKKIRAIFIENLQITEQDKDDLCFLSNHSNIAILFLNQKYAYKGILEESCIFLADYQSLLLDENALMQLLHLKRQQVFIVNSRRSLKKALSYIRIEKNKIYNYRTKVYRTLLAKSNDQHSLSKENFIEQAKITISFSYDNNPHLESIYRLFRKSKKQYLSSIETRKQLLDVLANPDLVSVSVFADSKYGSYGLIAFVSFEAKNRRVTQFVVDDYHNELNVENTIVKHLNLVLPPDIEGQFCNDIQFVVSNYTPIADEDIFFKGPCDVRFIWEQFSTLCLTQEFTYTNTKGISIESVNHFLQTIESLSLDEDRKKQILKEIPFIDEKSLSKKIIEKPYKVIVASVLTDANLGVYEKNDKSYRIVFGEKKHKIAKKTIKKWLTGEYAASKYKFDREYLEWFVENFHYYGETTPKLLKEYISTILQILPTSTRIVIIGGVELKYRSCTSDNYKRRNKLHHAYRKILEKNFNCKENFKLISINDYIFDQSDFAGHYNHFARYVYYNLAIDLISYIDNGLEKKYDVKLF